MNLQNGRERVGTYFDALLISKPPRELKLVLVYQHEIVVNPSRDPLLGKTSARCISQTGRMVIHTATTGYADFGVAPGGANTLRNKPVALVSGSHCHQ